jgi:hypothetical protein
MPGSELVRTLCIGDRKTTDPHPLDVSTLSSDFPHFSPEWCIADTRKIRNKMVNVDMRSNRVAAMVVRFDAKEPPSHSTNTLGMNIITLSGRR